VVDSGDERLARPNLLEEPLGHLLTAPVPVLSLGAEGGLSRLGRRSPGGGADLQLRKPGKRRSPPRVVDADVLLKTHCSLRPRTVPVR
jgi:hypothetical protein